MTQRFWGRVRWIPTVVLGLLGVLTAPATVAGPSGCSLGVMSDFESVRQLSRSWFPPEVTCEFTYRQQTLVEHQPSWEFLMPVSFLLGAVACGWYATRHRLLPETASARSWSRQVLGVVLYWVLAVLTPAGLVAMLWRDKDATFVVVLPLVTIPLLPLWTLQWLWRASTWPTSENSMRLSLQIRQGWGPGRSGVHPASRPGR